MGILVSNLTPSHIRSSSFNTWQSCEWKYFLQYGLNLRDKPWKATVKGSCVHKILELFAKVKLAKECGQGIYKDELGDYPTDRYDLNRYWDDTYNFFQRQESHLRWNQQDKLDVLAWTEKVLDSPYNPTRLAILEVEKFFDFEIREDWARLNKRGRPKYLRICGTVDLVLSDEPGIIELVDWKTGQRKDWNTGEKKTFAKLCKDPQLLIYYYAARKLFPDAKRIDSTIFFINDGGPFTIPFDDESYGYAENMLKEHLEELRSCEDPKPIRRTHVISATSRKISWRAPRTVFV
jgi:ATP-dependent helicase/DNAse subunit B